MRQLFRYCGFAGKLALVIGLMALGLCGCAAYQPLPLTSESLQKRLQAPDMAAVRLQVDELKLPFAPPQPFDERDGLSPEEAAMMAVVVNPGLQVARDRKGLAAAQLIQAGILPNPQISYELTHPSGGDTKGTVNGFGFGLGWDISSLLTRPGRLDAARAQSSAIDLEIAWQEWQVATAAKLHTYHLIIAEKRLKLLQKAEKCRAELRQKMEQGAESGVKTRTDLATATISLQESQAELVKAQSHYELERLALNRVLGLPATVKIPLAQDIALPLPQSPAADKLFLAAQNHRLDLQALRLGYESQEAQVRTAVRAQFPQINLGFSSGKDTDSLRTIGFGISIDLPLFDRNQGEIARQRASRQQLFDEYVNRLFTTRADIDHLTAALSGARLELAGLEQALAKEQTLNETFSAAVQNGQLDLFSYYETLHRLYRTRLQTLKLRQKIIDLGLALEVASGNYGLFSQKDTIQRD